MGKNMKPHRARILMRWLGVAIAVSTALCIGGELEDIGKVVAQEKKQLRVKEVLRRLGVMKNWTEKRDRELLLDADSAEGGSYRIYQCPHHKDLSSITVSGDLADGGQDELTNLLVTTILIDTFDMYRGPIIFTWDGKAYRKIFPKNPPAPSGRRKGNQMPNKSE